MSSRYRSTDPEAWNRRLLQSGQDHRAGGFPSPPICCVPVWADGRAGMGIKAGEGGREALCLSSLLEHFYAL